MKKRAVLKVLAMLLAFVMISSNVFAAADKSDGASNSATQRAAETGGNVTIEVSGGATLNEDKTAVIIATQAVSGSSATVSVSGYESITSNYLVYKSVGSQLDAVFGAPTFADGNITITLAIPDVTETTTYTIPAKYFVWQNGNGEEVYSVEITVTATVAETPTDPEEPTSPSDPEEPTSPSDPEEPTSPSDPEEPTNPSDPEQPTDPTEPSKPADVEEAEKKLENVLNNEAIKNLDENASPEEKESAAAIIEEAVKDLAEDKEELAEVLRSEDNQKAQELYKELDDKAQIAKNVTIEHNMTVRDSVVKREEIKVTGLALAAEKGKKVGLAVSEATGSTKKPVPSTFNASTAVQLDIKLTGDGIQGAPSVPITITMPIPSGLGKNVRLFHYHDDSTNGKELKIIVKDGMITFTVTDFSTFMFVEAKTTTPTQPSNPSTPSRPSRPSGGWSSSSSSSSSSSTSSTVKVNTWIKSATGWKLRLANGTYPVSQWLKVNNLWYFFGGDGLMAEGWKMIDGKWYYLNPSDGYMAEGWKLINGKWYYLNPSDGYMAEGWKMINGKWYYLNPSSGDMATGWKKLDGKWYYMTSDGDCLMNTTTPDGYQVDSNGAMISK